MGTVTKRGEKVRSWDVKEKDDVYFLILFFKQRKNHSDIA